MRYMSMYGDVTASDYGTSDVHSSDRVIPELAPYPHWVRSTAQYAATLLHSARPASALLCTPHLGGRQRPEAHLRLVQRGDPEPRAHHDAPAAELLVVQGVHVAQAVPQRLRGACMAQAWSEDEASTTQAAHN